MARLFIAAIIPEEIKKELLSQKLRKKFGENLRKNTKSWKIIF